MLWVKAFHIIAMVTWFAGLFYLPRLYVYHSMAQDEISRERFKMMERKLYYGIMTPGAILTISLGLWLASMGFTAYLQQRWFIIKLALVVLLILFHFCCGKWRLDFKLDRNRHTHVFYRWVNEIPTVLLIGIIVLVVVKPF